MRWQRRAQRDACRPDTPIDLSMRPVKADEARARPTTVAANGGDISAATARPPSSSNEDQARPETTLHPGRSTCASW